MQILPILKIAASLFAWICICFIGPREYNRRELIRHYRSWLETRAYWGRSSYKWIIGDLVFYTDEFWSDIWGSLLHGCIFNFICFVTFGSIGSGEDGISIVIAGFIVSPLLLCFSYLYDRVSVLKDEIARKIEITPKFQM